MDDAKEFGKRGEELAARHLSKLGYEVIDKNYRTQVGEIDIVAKEGGTLVFVEVKSRRDENFGPPELAVNYRKRRQLTRAAFLYLTRKKKQNEPCRFDVVCVSVRPEGVKVSVIRDAFELAGGY